MKKNRLYKIAKCITGAAIISGLASAIMVGIAIKWFTEDCKKAGAVR